MNLFAHFLRYNIEPVVKAALDMSILAKLGSIMVGVVLAFLLPVKPFVMAVYALLIADMILGIWASRVYKESFTARKLGRSIGKFVTYSLAIILAQIMVNTFFDGAVVLGSMTYVVALFICSIEFRSALENIALISGVELWATVSSFLSSKVKQGDPPPDVKKRKTTRKREL